jgi:hypothetical protein
MNEYQRATDSVHEIQLTSAITNAVWGNTQASVGEEVAVEVRTEFVGDRSEVRITVRNSSGRRLDRFTGMILGDRYKAPYTVSDRAQEAIYFEAELRRHGLSMQSEEMEIVPSVTITNAQWSAQESRRGEILELTADVEGATDGTEAVIEIYEHDQDEAHDFITRISQVMVENNRIATRWTYEYHEDTDEIPTQEEDERGYNPPEYFFRVKIRQSSADSGMLTFKDWFEIQLSDDEDNPMADVEFVLYMPDGSERKGQLDANGYARVEDVPPGKIFVEFPDVQSLELVMPEENKDTTKVIQED